MHDIGAVVTIIVAIAGCGGFWEWWRALSERRNRAVSRDELEDLIETSLSKSATIQDLRDHIDQNSTAIEAATQWHAQHEEEEHRHRLIWLRQAMMEDPHDRLTHEHQLDSGREYLRSGGNGIGHVRYEQLLADYEWRMQQSDWDYTHRPPTDKTNTD